MKSSLKYIVVIIIISFGGGTIAYYLYPYFVKEEISTNHYDSALAVASVLVFIVYNLYLINLIRESQKKFSKLYFGVLCFLITGLLWFLVEITTFGFDLRALSLILSSVGLINFLIPYLDNAFNTLFDIVRN